jgi:cysteine desulfurase
MLQERAYLDHNATTPMRPAAVEAMIHALANLNGNPSSVHKEGRLSRAALDSTRKTLALAVGTDAKNVIFTSGATEALNTLLRPSPAITSHSGAKTTQTLLVLATEHSAALAGGGFGADRIITIPVDSDGIIQLTWLEEKLASLANADGFAAVTVAVQLANSETGVIQPVHAVSQLTDRFGALLVCDAVAAFGKINVNLAELNADAIVVSAHKFGGPKGIGAIILNGTTLQLQEPLLRGGGQEMRLRSGTENVPAIIAMGVAAAECTHHMNSENKHIVGFRDKLAEKFKAISVDMVVFGENSPRLPNTLNIAVPGVKAETALINFDLAGVSVSSGSACSSGKVKRSHVLDAMGVPPELAECALRFSLGWNTDEADILKAVSVFAKLTSVAQKASLAEIASVAKTGNQRQGIAA